jgi:hypothetical protein
MASARTPVGSEPRQPPARILSAEGLGNREQQCRWQGERDRLRQQQDRERDDWDRVQTRPDPPEGWQE